MIELNNDVREHLIGLAGDNPSILDWDAQVTNVIDGWWAYFRRYRIFEGEQMQELHAIIGARLQVGIVSIAPPRFIKAEVVDC